MLTPSESELLQRLGIGYLRCLEEVTFTIFFDGLFVVLFWASMVIYRRRGFSSRTTVFMFAATAFNFLLFNLNVGGQLSGFILFIRKALIETVDLPLTERRSIVNDALRIPNTIQFWGANLTVVVSDMIVIWRAWTLFQDHERWIIVVPCILWLGTLAMNFSYLIPLSTPTGYLRYSESDSASSKVITTISLSVATNALTTIIIGYKLWCYRADIVRNLGLSRCASPVQKILILLVESGVVYCMIQIGYLVTSLHADPNLFGVVVFAQLYSAVSAIYPTAVIVLVESQRSMVDVYGITPTDLTKGSGSATREARAATLGHLSFATAPGQSMNDIESVDGEKSRILRGYSEGESTLGKPIDSVDKEDVV
jgi:hypothetical protein